MYRVLVHPEKKVILRDSSGLVREFSHSQAFIYNFMAIGFYGFHWATLFSVGYTQEFLGANIGLAILLMAISAIPFYLSTSMLSSAMPKLEEITSGRAGSCIHQSDLLRHFLLGRYGNGDSASFLGVVMTTVGYQPLFALLGLTNNGDETLPLLLRWVLVRITTRLFLK